MSITSDFFIKEIALEKEERKEETQPPLIKEPLIYDSTSEITLEFLMNKQAYLKYISKDGVKIANNLKDKHFYKKRIYDLTKQLMHNELSDSNDINNAFDNYINYCIQHFKLVDTTDILQEDYANMPSEELCNYDVENSKQQINEYITRQIKYNQPNSLEKMVKRTIIQSDKPAPILPKVKEVNLTDPALRFKGIKSELDVPGQKNEPGQKNDQKNELDVPGQKNDQKNDQKNELDVPGQKNGQKNKPTQKKGKNNNIDNSNEKKV
jgi:hypothetical protein